MKKILLLCLFVLTLQANIMQDIERFNIYLEKAKQGDRKAKYVTALNYFQAKGTQKDTKRGLEWLERAAEDGCIKAIWLISKIQLASSDEQAQKKGRKILHWLADGKNKEKKVYTALALFRLAELTQNDEEKTTYYLRAFAINESKQIKADIRKKAVAYLDTRDKTKQEIFDYTIERGDLKFLQNHLERLKDLNKFYIINKYLPQTARYRVDMTPLLMAIENDNITLARELIKRGADINLANSRGESPLLCAMRNKNVTFAKELIKLGADTSVLDNEKHSVFSYALALGDEELALQVLQNKKFDIHQWVSGAVFDGTFDAYAEYISTKKSTYEMCNYLHLAAKNDASEVIKKLVALGLDVNDVTHSDRLNLDPLGIAARYASLKSIKTLMALGANPYMIYINKHPEGNYGLSYWGGLSSKYTPLSMALCRENRDSRIVKYLLSLKDAKWYVEHESEYFYLYLLQIKDSIVLQFFDENGFKDKERVREQFERVSK